ncbi:hypothetical protein [Nocardiopsis potens]|uniref:hypothetical protein n=1 Tax=Nocardiopsis potens TaxID=1246458 RepID=UPI000344F4BA|nr:hypothetical protein [Nocardiopsis potens]
MDGKERDLDDLVREELGEEPSQEAKDYARLLYEKYRLPAPAPESGGAEDADGVKEGE